MEVFDGDLGVFGDYAVAELVGGVVADGGDAPVETVEPPGSVGSADRSWFGSGQGLVGPPQLNLRGVEGFHPLDGLEVTAVGVHHDRERFDAEVDADRDLVAVLGVAVLVVELGGETVAEGSGGVHRGALEHVGRNRRPPRQTSGSGASVDDTGVSPTTLRHGPSSNSRPATH